MDGAALGDLGDTKAVFSYLEIPGMLDASASGSLWLVAGILIVTLAVATNRIESNRT
jgi:hypothetical protein